MSIIAPFQQTGNTVLVAVTNSSQRVAIANYDPQMGSPAQCLITNISNVNIWFTFLVSNAGSVAIPVANTPANGMLILPSAIMTISCPGANYIAAIAGVAGPNSLIVTPGEGA